MLPFTLSGQAYWQRVDSSLFLIYISTKVCVFVQTHVVAWVCKACKTAETEQLIACLKACTPVLLQGAHSAPTITTFITFTPARGGVAGCEICRSLLSGTEDVPFMDSGVWDVVVSEGGAGVEVNGWVCGTGAGAGRTRVFCGAACFDADADAASCPGLEVYPNWAEGVVCIHDLHRKCEITVLQ